MSYVVFALKWRPRNFDELVGQPQVVATLKNALEKSRLAHAYLFAGPRGVGKTSTARILAKSLNCKEGPTVNPCGKCGPCKDIAEARSLDVIEIDGASNRGIEEVRVLRENIKFAPVGGKFKVYIIDEVHMLTTEAFNALLKTLEEPPEFVKFIFATTQPNKVLPTILSRCQRLDFRRIPAVEIVSQLEKIAAAEKVAIDREVLFAIAKSSDGALRDAESILDQLVSVSRERISLGDVVSVLGLVEHDILFDMADRLIRKDPKGCLETLNRVIDEGKDLAVFAANLIEHYRNLMIAKVASADAKLIDMPQELCNRLLEQAKGISLEDIFITFNTLVNAQETAKRLESLRIPLEVALVKLAHDKKSFGAAVPPERVAPVGQEPVSTRAPAAPAQPQVKNTPPALPQTDSETHASIHHRHSEPLVALEAIQDKWTDIIDGLSRVKMSVATYMNEGRLMKVEGGVLTVSFPKDYSLHKESLETKENRSLIEKTIAELLNVRLRVNFILSKEALPTIEDVNPLLKSALETFKGKIIKEE